LFTEIDFVFGFERLAGALLDFGKLTFVPDTEAVHIRMKMTRRTNTKSTIGVMFT
jgi:hypothetical protein